MLELLAVVTLQSLFIICSAGLVLFYLGLTVIRILYEVAEQGVHLFKSSQSYVKEWLHTAKQSGEKIEIDRTFSKPARSAS